MPPQKTVSHPAMAPMVMMPSMPRLSTPARSQIRAPSTPKIKGVAMRSTAAHRLALARMSKVVLSA